MIKLRTLSTSNMTPLPELQDRIRTAIANLEIEKKELRAAELEENTRMTDFWSDQQKAQATFTELKSLQKIIELWRGLEKEARGLAEMEGELDDAIRFEWQDSVKQLADNLEKAEVSLFLSGKYDHAPAIVTIWAGTGGTDAQDWVSMLLRMYLRFAENEGWRAEILEERAGEEAGLKSVMVEFDGGSAFGYMRRERGTHRLIRQSPFNAKSLRQTSFAGVTIVPFVEHPEEIDVEEKDLRIDTYRSSGAGGQHVNKTDSAVRITHIPTGIVTTCQNGRSQIQNKEKAMQVLKSRLLAKKLEEEEKEIKKASGTSFSADFGAQIRTVTLHPYQQVKDHRTNYESSQTEKYLDGEVLPFIEAAMRGGY